MIKPVLKKIICYPSIARRLVKGLLILHNKSYQLCGMLSASLEPNGLHSKHRIMRYHDWFLEHIAPEWTVLDVGCGNGALLRDVAMKTKAIVVGVDISEDNVKSAKKRLADLPNVEIIQADIWKYKDNRHFDTIMLSNVLEHIDNSLELLKHLKAQFKPKKFLIRVPMFEREWLVPYKKELGVEWRLDYTHKIEYTEDELRDELAKAGLDVQEIKFRWGEMYAIAVPAREGIPFALPSSCSDPEHGFLID